MADTVDPTCAPIPRSTLHDERRLTFDGVEWPLEAPPFVEPEFHGWQHRLQYWALRAATRGAAALPAPLQRALVASVAGVARRVDRRHSDAAREFLRAALPALPGREHERLVVEAWRHLLRVALVAEGVQQRILGRRLGDCYEVHAPPEVEELVVRPGGFVCVTAHVGYWEASSPGVAAYFGRPCYAVGKAPRNDFVAAHVQRLREAQGMRIVPRKGAMQVIPGALRAGCVAGLLLDHRPRQKPVMAPFFGRLAACDRSAGVLLRRVDAPIVFYGCYALGRPWAGDPWRFELRFTRLVRPDELSGLSPEEIATLVNHELEALILYRPEQYFWLHDRYRGAPREAPDAALSTSSHRRDD